MPPKVKDTTPEPRYPAAEEDVDTIITGSDGKDYVVELIEDIKKWVPYLPDPNDVIIIDKVLPPLNAPNTNSKSNSPKNNQDQKPMTWQDFSSDMSEKIKKENPNLTGAQRKAKVSELWKEYKANLPSSAEKKK